MSPITRECPNKKTICHTKRWEIKIDDEHETELALQHECVEDEENILPTENCWFLGKDLVQGSKRMKTCNE